METVIPPDKKSGHVIQKYRFKTLVPDEIERDEGDGSGVQPYAFKELKSLEEAETETSEESAEGKSKEENSSAEEAKEESSEGEMVEELLKRIDELSTELVKTQMLLEKREGEFEDRLKKVRSEGFEEGKEAGRQSCAEELKRELEPLRNRLVQSVEALDRSRELFLSKVDSIEEELIETALDLAKQVVVKEIEHNSKEVALRLAKLLLTEIKEASEITLKVNPDDYEYLKEHLRKREGLQVVPDPMVGAGGVVILSDVGHIDGEIMHRFERIKEAVFGTVNAKKQGRE